MDHDIPLSRGGNNHDENLVFCDQSCNRAKGNLLGAEYRQLLAALRAFSDESRRSVLARLKAGGGFYR